MIRPLRTAHRRVFAALVVALPISLGLTLLDRPQAPALPAAERAAEISIEGSADGRLQVRIGAPASRPEWLVYLDDGPGGDRPGSAARLLGTVRTSGEVFELPPGTQGDVLVYSVLTGTVVVRQRIGVAP